MSPTPEHQPYTEAEVQAQAARLLSVSDQYTGNDLPEREPAVHRWLDRACTRTHPDGYGASNHARVYQRYQALVAARNGWPYSEEPR